MRSYSAVSGLKPALILGALLVSVTTACSDKNSPVQGFILPPGDYEKGKETFVEIGCPQCHTVSGADVSQPEDSTLHVELGGKVRQVKHYGDLLTSIINPNHKVAVAYRVPEEGGKEFSSPMPNFTDRMTVAEMVNIVEFLHASYEKSQQAYLGRYYYYGP